MKTTRFKSDKNTKKRKQYNDKWWSNVMGDVRCLTVTHWEYSKKLRKEKFKRDKNSKKRKQYNDKWWCNVMGGPWGEMSHSYTLRILQNRSSSVQIQTYKYRNTLTVTHWEYCKTDHPSMQIQTYKYRNALTVTHWEYCKTDDPASLSLLWNIVSK